MKTGNRFVFLLISLLLLPFAVNAGLYKWVDENGKVQYSDKPPPESKNKKVESMTTQPTSTFQSKKQPRPMLKPTETEARKLLLPDTTYFWERDTGQQYSRKIGSYFVGKNCSPRGAIEAPAVFTEHSQFLPDTTKYFTYAIRRAISSLDYDSERVEEHELLAELKRSAGLSLHSEIAELRIESCAPKVSASERNRAARNISAGRFTRHRVRLKMRWQLKDDRDRKLIYETATIGTADAWRDSGSLRDVIEEAIGESLYGLFNDEEWLQQVLIRENNIDLGPYLVAKPRPIKMPRSLWKRKIYLSLDPWQWKGELVGQEKFGNLYFGKNCQAGNPMTIREMAHYRKNLIPSKTPAQIAVINATKKLGYAFRNEQPSLLAKARKNNGFIMTGELLSLSLDACAPRLTSAQKYAAIDSISWTSFVRQKVKLKIRWSLFRGADKQPIYQAETVGYGGDLSKRWDNKKAFTNAISFSAKTLLAKPQFARLITQE